jgi:ABC-type amino acid transport substrate-binding protein
LLGAGCACAADTPTLTVCMAENNPPLSYRVASDSRGLDVRVAEAIAAELQRALKVVPFESKYEHESTLAQEVNALLSSAVCDMASGFALLAGDLGPPGRPTARVPDYPGAKRPPQRPWVPLGTLVATRPYHAMAMALVVRDPARQTATLADLGDARIGVVSGTLAGTAVSLYRNGKLRDRIVSLAQNQNVLEELEAGRFDATQSRSTVDTWRLTHPASTLHRAAYTPSHQHRLGRARRRSRAVAPPIARSDAPRRTEISSAGRADRHDLGRAGPAAVAATIGLPDLVRE